MAKLFSAFGILTGGVFVAIALASKVSEYHRTFFVLFDVACVAYLCFFNMWFRNKLIGWTDAATKEPF